MDVHIRPGMEVDIPWLLPRLQDLAGRYGAAHWPYDAEYARERLPVFMASHCCLIAEQGATAVGAVGGMLTPHVLNPAILVLTEVFWIAEVRRAALALVDAYAAWGHERGAAWVTFSLIPGIPAGHRALERRGFRRVEAIYLKEN